MFTNKYSFILLFFIFLNGSYMSRCQSSEDSTMKKLRDHLLKGYDASLRPVLDQIQTTLVTFKLFPVHLTDMDEKQTTLKMDAYAHMSWQDDYLKWNPDNFFGIKKIHFQAGEIWRPDIKMFNGRSYLTTPWMFGGLSVDSSGKVTWVPAALMFAICTDFDYAAYPNDVQKCKLLLGSWTSSQLAIDYQLEETVWDLGYYKKSNPQWEITNFQGKKLIYKDAANDTQVVLSYDIELKRINVPHVALGSVPDTVARVLLLCTFWLPDLTKKLLVGTSALILLTLIAVSVNSLLPSPAAAPAALFEINAALGLGLVAIILEILLSILSGWNEALPPFLNRLSTTWIFRTLSSRTQKEGADAGQSKTEPRQEVLKIEPWGVLAFLIEKILFLIFCVLLLAV